MQGWLPVLLVLWFSAAVMSSSKPQRTETALYSGVSPTYVLVSIGPVADVSAYGGGADGMLLPGSCGKNSCYKGTNNSAAIRAAISALPQGGVVYFPNSGTNIWMVGSAADYRACNESRSMFALPSFISLEGQGQWTTTIMLNPGLGGDLN